MRIEEALERYYQHQAATQLYTPLGGYKPAIIEDEDNE